MTTEHNWHCALCALLHDTSPSTLIQLFLARCWRDKSSFLCSKFKFDLKSFFLFLSLSHLCHHRKDRSSLCIHCWKCTGFFGSWRLSFPYVALGVALLMWPHNLWLSYVGGAQLIILALLRMFTIFRINIRGREDSLLPEFDDPADK